MAILTNRISTCCNLALGNSGSKRSDKSKSKSTYESCLIPFVYFTKKKIKCIAQLVELSLYFLFAPQPTSTRRREAIMKWGFELIIFYFVEMWEWPDHRQYHNARPLPLSKKYWHWIVSSLPLPCPFLFHFAHVQCVGGGCELIMTSLSISLVPHELWRLNL